MQFKRKGASFAEKKSVHCRVYLFWQRKGHDTGMNYVAASKMAWVRDMPVCLD